MITRIQCSPRMSQAVVHGNTVYLAGQVASDGSADTAGQTREVLAAIDELLAEAGTDKRHLLAATIYLTDMSTFNEMNAVWEAWIAPAARLRGRLSRRRWPHRRTGSKSSSPPPGPDGPLSRSARARRPGRQDRKTSCAADRSRLRTVSIRRLPAERSRVSRACTMRGRSPIDTVTATAPSRTNSAP